MGHSSSLVFVEVDGFLSLQGHGPVPNGVSIRSALQAANPRQFCSMGVLGRETLSSDTRVGRTDGLVRRGPLKTFCGADCLLERRQLSMRGGHCSRMTPSCHCVPSATIEKNVP